jgi:hypothetical protein
MPFTFNPFTGNFDNIITANQAAKEIFTLAAGDITNGYVDLTNEAINDSIRVTPIGGMEQEVTADYTLSVVSGVTRVTFAGDLAAELIAGDKLQVAYLYR